MLAYTSKMSHKSCLTTLCESLTAATQQITNDGFQRNQEVSLQDFWTTYINTSKLISHESTKLCMAVTNPPRPPEEDLKLMAKSLETACLAFINVYCSLPHTNAQTLTMVVQRATQELLKAVQDVCIEASQEGSVSQLKSIGNVWEQCNSILILPKINKEAVLQTVQDQLGTVNDALLELEESLENEQQESDGSSQFPEELWTDADKQLLPSCKGLVKASRAVLKKTSSMLQSLEEDYDNPILDTLASEVSTISAHVDDFVLSCYAPMRHSTLRINGSTLADSLKRILGFIRDSELGTDWVAFLLRAVNHNMEKIIDLALED